MSDKLKSYQIKVKYTFEGVVEVRAEDKTRAKEIVDKGFGASIDLPSKTGWDSNNPEDEGIVDWNFDLTPVQTTMK
jgi:hypothetical protein